MPNYYPILKWRQREVAALKHLLPRDQDNVAPIFELPLEPWDFDTGRPLDRGLLPYQGFGSRLADAWAGRACAVDVPHLGSLGTALQSMVLDSVFHQARANGCRARPVVGLDRSESYVRAVRRIADTDGHGLCIRVRLTDSRDSLDGPLTRLLLALRVMPEQCDLLIDFEGSPMPTVARHAEAVCSIVGGLTLRGAWRTLVLGCTSMPPALPIDLYSPYGIVTRSDWSGYLAALKGLQESVSEHVELEFADYGVHHPNAEMIDPRLIGRDLALVYAIDQDWVVFTSRERDASGIREIARAWKRYTTAMHVDGIPEAPCWGDLQVERMCEDEILDTEIALWPRIATNRHLSVVSRQMRRCRSAQGVWPSSLGSYGSSVD